MSSLVSRRAFLALAGSGLLVPAPRVLAAARAERKFLFLHCEGGWDILKVFTPMFGVAGVQMDATASLGSAGGLRTGPALLRRRLRLSPPQRPRRRHQIAWCRQMLRWMSTAARLVQHARSTLHDRV